MLVRTPGFVFFDVVDDDVVVDDDGGLWGLGFRGQAHAGAPETPCLAAKRSELAPSRRCKQVYYLQCSFFCSFFFFFWGGGGGVLIILFVNKKYQLTVRFGTNKTATTSEGCRKTPQCQPKPQNPKP